MPGEGPGGGPISSLTPLKRDGLRLRDGAGNDWRARGIDAYNIVGLILEGKKPQARKYLLWSKQYGVNCARWFNMWWNLNLSPKLPGFYDALKEAIELCTELGIRPWPVRYCDQDPSSGSPILLSTSERQDYDNTLPTIYTDIIIDEMMNEPWQNGNFAGSLSRIRNIIATRGAANDSQLPDAPGAILDFTTHHTPRGHEQTRKAKEMADVALLGWDTWNPSGHPAMAGEPPHVNKDDWTNPQLCADYYALCDLFGAGGVIHGGYAPDGSNAPFQSCEIPTDPNTLACLEAIKAVWIPGNDVPPGTFAEGRYLRGTADNTGDLGINHWDRYTDHGENRKGALRTFAMQVGNRQIIVPVDRGPEWTLGLRNGYRLIEQRGFNGNIIIVERF